MTMDNTKAHNKLFTKSNHLTERRDPLGGTFFFRALRTGLDRNTWVTNFTWETKFRKLHSMFTTHIQPNAPGNDG